ncbi:MAG: LTA synthase family protein [Deltaproteobacteria bacterium]|nr:LTA synthase family protein [Deltaproteobacteria bacterium]
MRKLIAIDESPHPLKESAALLAATCLAPFGLRLNQLIELEASFGVGDLRGLLSDLMVSAVLAAVLLVAQQLRFKQIGRLVGLPLLWLWVGFQCGNFEHVRALGTAINWVYLGFVADGTFFTGSMLHVSHPVTFALALLGSTALYWWATRSRTWRALLGAGATAVVATLVLLPWQIDPDAATWRQRHFLPENLRWSGASEAITASTEDIPGLYPGDLDGEPIVEIGHPGTNVLLVVLEGISGAYLESVARAQGVAPPKPRLPSLDKRALQHLSFINFVNHQRQTNRGLYTLLCGDLPKQITGAPKMSELGFGTGEIGCLPALLRREGYETVFVQSAPLGFMGKDKFMPRAGFSRVHGVEWFERGQSRGQWGVDDQAFFAQVQPLIEELRRGPKPFFLTLLTAGTHHPFTVPDGFVSDNESGSFAHAVDYLDQALRPLLGYLESSGVLDDTLVVFTSDESFGIDGTDDVDSLVIAQAFGTLTVMVPGGFRRQVAEPFMQLDVALSVLDYLGYRERRGMLGGRSVFRAYRNPRPLPFANTYMRMSNAISVERDLFTCAEDFTRCRRYGLQPDRLFAPTRESREAGPDDVRFVKQIAARSLHLVGQSKAATWPLIATGQPIRLQERAAGERIDVFSSQYLPVDAGDRIEVDVEFEIVGEPCELKVRHGLYAVPRDAMPTAMDYAQVRASDEERAKLGLKGESTLGMRPRFQYQTERLHRVTKKMYPGGRFRIKYSYGAAEDLERLNCAVFVWVKDGPPPKLLFRRALLSISTIGDDEQPGKKIEAFDFEPGEAPPTGDAG